MRSTCRWVRVDVEPSRHVRFGFPRRHPLRIVVFITTIIKWYDIHQQYVLGSRIESFNWYFERWKHTSANISVQDNNFKRWYSADNLHAYMHSTLSIQHATTAVVWTQVNCQSSFYSQLIKYNYLLTMINFRWISPCWWNSAAATDPSHVRLVSRVWLSYIGL